MIEPKSYEDLKAIVLLLDHKCPRCGGVIEIRQSVIFKDTSVAICVYCTWTISYPSLPKMELNNGNQN